MQKNLRSQSQKNVDLNEKFLDIAPTYFFYRKKDKFAKNHEQGEILCLWKLLAAI